MDNFASKDFIKPPDIKIGYNIPQALSRRSYGASNQVPKELQYMAEETLIMKKHEEFPCKLPDVPRSTFLMVFSPDGTKIASTHGNHNVYVTELNSKRNVRTLSGHPRTPWCIAFHPSSNQILASGCLGGQVRVWDLHGGSEVWMSDSQTVIASLAFHPRDRLLVIASYNEIFFWDWSCPKPFARSHTTNEKDKVRYVAFDPLGHKLLTGVANAPFRIETQWNRIPAPPPPPPPPPEEPFQNEYERRIIVCYRFMVQQYEQLVHRYRLLMRARNTQSAVTDSRASDLFGDYIRRRSQRNIRRFRYGNPIPPRFSHITRMRPVISRLSDRRPFMRSSSGRSRNNLNITPPAEPPPEDTRTDSAILQQFESEITESLARLHRNIRRMRIHGIDMPFRSGSHSSMSSRRPFLFSSDSSDSEVDVETPATTTSSENNARGVTSAAPPPEQVSPNETLESASSSSASITVVRNPTTEWRGGTSEDHQDLRSRLLIVRRFLDSRPAVRLRRTGDAPRPSQQDSGSPTTTSPMDLSGSLQSIAQDPGTFSVRGCWPSCEPQPVREPVSTPVSEQQASSGPRILAVRRRGDSATQQNPSALYVPLQVQTLGSTVTFRYFRVGDPGSPTDTDSNLNTSGGSNTLTLSQELDLDLESRRFGGFRSQVPPSPADSTPTSTEHDSNNETVAAAQRVHSLGPRLLALGRLRPSEPLSLFSGGQNSTSVPGNHSSQTASRAFTLRCRRPGETLPSSREQVLSGNTGPVRARLNLASASEHPSPAAADSPEPNEPSLELIRETAEDVRQLFALLQSSYTSSLTQNFRPHERRRFNSLDNSYVQFNWLVRQIFLVSTVCWARMLELERTNVEQLWSLIYVNLSRLSEYPSFLSSNASLRLFQRIHIEGRHLQFSFNILPGNANVYNYDGSGIGTYAEALDVLLRIVFRHFNWLQSRIESLSTGGGIRNLAVVTRTEESFTRELIRLSPDIGRVGDCVVEFLRADFRRTIEEIVNSPTPRTTESLNEFLRVLSNLSSRLQTYILRIEARESPYDGDNPVDRSVFSEDEVDATTSPPLVPPTPETESSTPPVRDNPSDSVNSNFSSSLSSRRYRLLPRNDTNASSSDEEENIVNYNTDEEEENTDTDEDAEDPASTPSSSRTTPVYTSTLLKKMKALASRTMPTERSDSSNEPSTSGTQASSSETTSFTNIMQSVREFISQLETLIGQSGLSNAGSSDATPPASQQGSSSAGPSAGEAGPSSGLPSTSRLSNKRKRKSLPSKGSVLKLQRLMQSAARNGLISKNQSYRRRRECRCGSSSSPPDWFRFAVRNYSSPRNSSSNQSTSSSVDQTLSGDFLNEFTALNTSTSPTQPLSFNSPTTSSQNSLAQQATNDLNPISSDEPPEEIPNPTESPTSTPSSQNTEPLPNLSHASNHEHLLENNESETHHLNNVPTSGQSTTGHTQSEPVDMVDLSDPFVQSRLTSSSYARPSSRNNPTSTPLRLLSERTAFLRDRMKRLQNQSLTYGARVKVILDRAGRSGMSKNSIHRTRRPDRAEFLKRCMGTKKPQRVDLISSGLHNSNSNASTSRHPGENNRLLDRYVRERSRNHSDRAVDQTPSNSQRRQQSISGNVDSSSLLNQAPTLSLLSSYETTPRTSDIADSSFSSTSNCSFPIDSTPSTSNIHSTGSPSAEASSSTSRSRTRSGSAFTSSLPSARRSRGANMTTRSESGQSQAEKWRIERTRNRARNILAMMLKHISSFFRNASLLEVPTSQNEQDSYYFHERVFNLHRLLQLALHLTELLYAQLSLSRQLLDNLRSSLNSVTHLRSYLRHRQGSSSTRSDYLRRTNAIREAAARMATSREAAARMAVSREPASSAVPISIPVEEAIPLSSLSSSQLDVDMSEPTSPPQSDRRPSVFRTARGHTIRITREPAVPISIPVEEAPLNEDPDIPEVQVNNVNFGHMSRRYYRRHYVSPNRQTMSTGTARQTNDAPISVSAPISQPDNASGNDMFSRRTSTRRTPSPTSPPSFRPRFLHPRYAGPNPFDDTNEDPERELRNYVTNGGVFFMRDSYYSPHHRIQAWDFSKFNIPDLSNTQKNVVVKECKIHNDASVDISKNGEILVTLLPSSGRLTFTTMLGVYSLHWETLGQCLYMTSFELNAVSVSLSPTSRHLIVGLASRRVSLSSIGDRHTIAHIFRLEEDTEFKKKNSPTGGQLTKLRHIDLPRDTGYMSLNCIRWAPNPGQGLVYGTNTGLLRILE